MAADKDFGWRGVEHFSSARFFYGCTASDLTIYEKNALKLPTGTNYKMLSHTNAVKIRRELDVFAGDDDGVVKMIRNKITAARKVVVFCQDWGQAKERYDQLVHDLDQDAGARFHLFDPEEDDPSKKARNTVIFKNLEVQDKIDCIVTWRVGIRGINYWKQCYPVAWYQISTMREYVQFMGRSNRDYPAANTQNGAVIAMESAKLDQAAFEKTLN